MTYFLSSPFESSSFGVGLVLVPDVGVTVPDLVANLLRAGVIARCAAAASPDVSGSFGLPASMSSENVLTSTASLGKRHPGQRSRRGLRIDHRLVLDLRVARQGLKRSFTAPSDHNSALTE